MGTRKNGVGVSRQDRHVFYFVRPLPNQDAKSLPNRLMGLEGVEEVYVTEGKYGYIVRASVGDRADSIANLMGADPRNGVETALSHYSFRKR